MYIIDELYPLIINYSHFTSLLFYILLLFFVYAYYDEELDAYHIYIQIYLILIIYNKIEYISFLFNIKGNDKEKK